MTYEERLEFLIIDADWRNSNLYNSVIVFDIERNDRRNIFYQYLGKTHWRRFQEEIHRVGDDNYDYVLFENLNFTPLRLYQALKQHNGKILIFDSDMILSKKGLIRIVEGGICSNPNYSLHKWDVNLEGRPKFMFRGAIVILTSFKGADCKEKKKLNYVMRDCLKVWESN